MDTHTQGSTSRNSQGEMFSSRKSALVYSGGGSFLISENEDGTWGQLSLSLMTGGTECPWKPERAQERRGHSPGMLCQPCACLDLPCAWCFPT